MNSAPVPFLLAGGREDYVPRAPVIGLVRYEIKHAGVPPRTRSVRTCNVDGCEVEFTPRTRGQEACSFECARVLRHGI